MENKTETTVHLKKSLVEDVKAEANLIVQYDIKITNPKAFEILFNEYKKLKKVSA